MHEAKNERMDKDSDRWKGQRAVGSWADVLHSQVIGYIMVAGAGEDLRPSSGVQPARKKSCGETRAGEGSSGPAQTSRTHCDEVE